MEQVKPLTVVEVSPLLEVEEQVFVTQLYLAPDFNPDERVIIQALHQLVETVMHLELVVYLKDVAIFSF